MLCYVSVSVLYYAMLCCALCYAMLSYVSVSVQYYTLLCCAILCFDLLCYAMLCSVLCYAMLCFCAVLCYVMLCSVLCYAMLCFCFCAVLCYVKLCCTMLCFNILYFDMHCSALLCHAKLCCVVPYYAVLSCAEQQSPSTSLPSTVAAQDGTPPLYSAVRSIQRPCSFPLNLLNVFRTEFHQFTDASNRTLGLLVLKQTPLGRGPFVS